MSAHEAQCAGMAVDEADVRPRPPMWRGRCAMASASAGRGAVSSKRVKVVATARSWSEANRAVMSGGSIQSW